MSIPQNERRRDKTTSVSATRHGETFWSEESGNFGLKMMKTLGWEQGTGLGKHQQGQQQFLKAKQKQDSRGIGAGE